MNTSVTLEMTHASASVVPELPINTNTTKQPEASSTTTHKMNSEQTLLVERSKRRQFVALMNKHYSAYKRDTETLSSEIFTTVLYTVLLFIFALTSSTIITDAETYAQMPVELTTSITAAFALPFNSFNSENYTSACTGQDCYIAFGDTDTGTGCSHELNELLANMPMCAIPLRPFTSTSKQQLGCEDPNLCGQTKSCFSADACQARNDDGTWPKGSTFDACNAAAPCAPCFGNCNETLLTVSDVFTNFTGIHIPKCQCFPISGYNNYTHVQDQHIIAAVRFEPNFGNHSGYNYTMFLSGPKIPVDIVKFKSPLVEGGSSYAQSRQFKSTALQLQVAIDSAITGQDISVGVADFPTVKVERWSPGE